MSLRAKIKKRNLSKNTITMELTFPEPFAKGVANSQSAILRPLNKFLKNGSKIGRLAYLFYSENNFPSNVLGSILYSDGERLIFYPGLKTRRYLSSSNEAKTKLVGKNIDHITLETSKKDWHFTSLSLRKKDSFKTSEIAHNVYYWFGMSIRDKNCLEITPANTHLSFSVPDTDAERRIREMINSRHKSKYPHVLMSRLKPDNHFIHFDFIIDMRSFPKIRSRKRITKSLPPNTMPVLIEDVPVVQKIPVKQYVVQIPTFPGRLIINACYSSGNLSNESYITSVELKKIQR